MSELLEKLEEQQGFWKSLWAQLTSFFGNNDYEQYRQQLSEIAGEAIDLCKYNRATRKLFKITSFEE